MMYSCEKLKLKIIGLTGCLSCYYPPAREFKRLLDKDVVGQWLYANVESRSYLPGWRPGQDYKKTVSDFVENDGGYYRG